MAATFGSLILALSERLFDQTPGYLFQFWSQAELRIYLTEALRTWQSATMWSRQRDTFTAVAGTLWYDLTTVLAGNSLQQTVTDLDLVTSIQYRLLEPPGVPWTGTDQFTLSDVLGALQRRRDQFLSDTGCFLTHSTPAGGAGRLSLSSSVIDIRRLAWKDTASGLYTMLSREDEATLNAFAVGWSQTPGDPQEYSSSVTPPFVIQVAPPPGASGTLDLLSVNSGVVLDGSGVLIGVPNDFAAYVAWGALADLLNRDMYARDAQRSGYCEQRYQEGLILARLYTSNLQAQVSGVPCELGTVPEVDQFLPDWHNVTGTPEALYMAGMNIVAVSPLASATTGISVDLVANCPLPANDAAPVLLSDDMLDVILDEAAHEASFKMGGAEFIATIPNHQRFLRMAAEVNGKLDVNTLMPDMLKDKAIKPRREHPERETEEVAA